MKLTHTNYSNKIVNKFLELLNIRELLELKSLVSQYHSDHGFGMIQFESRQCPRYVSTK